MKLYSSIGVADIWTRAKYSYRQFPMVIPGYLVFILSGEDCRRYWDCRKANNQIYLDWFKLEF